MKTSPPSSETTSFTCSAASSPSFVNGTGKPRTNELRHDFGDWCQILDYIRAEHPRIMDGHQEAQERVSNPVLSWVRNVTLELAGAPEPAWGELMTASALVSVYLGAGIDLPNRVKVDEKQRPADRGRIMRGEFKASPCP